MIEPVIKRIEFYNDRVMKRVEQKKRRVLFRLGAYIRQTMKRSIRVSRKSSEPGQPPRVRKSNSPLRQLITFHVDLAQETVTVGPMIFSGSKVKSSKPLPELLNEGGTFRQVRRDGGSVLAQVRPRPFTDAAFETGQTKFMELLQDEPL